MKPLPNQALLRQLFDYDQSTGHLVWRFGKRDGKRAGYLCGARGKPKYRYVWLADGGMFKEHRIIWKWMTGGDPPDEVDHINGVRDDNRWVNLRIAMRSDNQRNVRTRSRSGFRGATFHKASGLWTARIMYRRLTISLGYHRTPEEAAAAYRGALLVFRALGNTYIPDEHIDIIAKD